ncbi:MAG TPA: hypothetical protein VI861_00920, partial [Rickettsiales bacterium]|nr:hypothetical protein [Rickettsiales bacterium]
MTLKLAYSLNFFDLYNNKGLRKIDSFFHEFFAQKNHELYKNFCVYKNLDKKQRDEVLINSAKVLEDFLVYLFDIEKENSVLKKQHDDLQKIYFVKREFVQRIIAKKYKTAPDINGLKILQDLKISFENIDDLEKKLAQRIFLLLSENHNEEFEKLSLYAVFALYCEEGKALHRDGSLFILPQKIDHDNLVGGCGMDNKKIRDGFNLTDSGFNLNKTLSEAHYCIFCHKQEKDSCRNGLREKNSADFQKNP